MCEVEIKLNTIEDVKKLVSDVTRFECDFELKKTFLQYSLKNCIFFIISQLPAFIGHHHYF